VATARRTQAQISASEEQSNAQHASAVVPASAATATQRLSVAAQEKKEEEQMDADSSSVVATDDDIDEDMNSAKEQESARARAFNQDVAQQRAALSRDAKKKQDKHAVSYSYNSLYQQALAKEKKRSDEHRQNVKSDETKMQNHIQSQIADIEGKTQHKLTADQIRQRAIEQQNNQHLASQVYTYMHTYLHTYTRIYTHIYIHAHIHTHTHTYIHAYIHACVHTSTMHTCI
jgi:hypothetical protein